MHAHIQTQIHTPTSRKREKWGRGRESEKQKNIANKPVSAFELT